MQDWLTTASSNEYSILITSSLYKIYKILPITIPFLGMNW